MEESHPLAEGLQCAPAGWALCCRVKRMDSGSCSWTPASNASQPSELDNLCTLSRLQFPCLCNGSNNSTCCSGLICFLDNTVLESWGEGSNPHSPSRFLVIGTHVHLNIKMCFRIHLVVHVAKQLLVEARGCRLDS